VTTPAPQQQPPPPVQPPPPPDSALDSPLFVTAVSAALLTVGPVAAVIAALKVRFALSQAAWTALSGSLGIAMEHPPPLVGVVGPASAQTARQNLARRAQFVVSAGKRLMADMTAWRAKPPAPEPTPSPEPVPGPASGQAADLNVLRRGQFTEARRGRLQADIDASEAAGRMQALQDGLARERRYYAQHLDAMWNRARAAGQIDMEAAVHGPLLGWAARHDKRVTAACLAADGGNFYVDDPPDIGLPGIGPHAGCRCTAVAPWPGGRLLAGSGASRRR